MMILGQSLSQIIVLVIAVILSMSIHEVAHGLVSYWFGDPTARQAGRLSLNPFAHIDWSGLLCLLLFGFGWAKPVPVDPRYYKDPKAGMIWTAFAGPLANFLLSFVCVFLYYLRGLWDLQSDPCSAPGRLQNSVRLSSRPDLLPRYPGHPLDVAGFHCPAVVRCDLRSHCHAPGRHDRCLLHSGNVPAGYVNPSPFRTSRSCCADRFFFFFMADESRGCHSGGGQYTYICLTAVKPAHSDCLPDG